ncbi:MAG: M16 family metallopeptidase [Planctomycetota bacterium]
MKTLFLACVFGMGIAPILLAGEPSLPSAPGEIKFPISYWAPPNPANYRKVVAGNAVVFLARDPDLPRMSVEVVLRPPAASSPLLGSVLGEIMTRGGPASMEEGSFRERLVSAGSCLRVHRERGCLILGLTTRPEGFEEGIRVFAETLKDPRLGETALEAVKAESLLACEGAMEDLRERERWCFLHHAASGAAGLPTRDAIAAITVKDLKAFHESAFRLGRFTLAVAGPLGEEDVLGVLDREFHGFPVTGKVPTLEEVVPAVGGGRFLIVDRETRLASCTAGYASPTFGSEDRPAFQIAFQILAARVREKLLAGRIGETPPSTSFLTDPLGREYAVFVFYRPPTKSVALLSSIVEEAERLAREAPKPPEIQRALDATKRRRILDFASLKTRMRFFAVSECRRGPDGWPAGVYGGLLAVTGAKVRAVASRLMNPKAFLTVVAGPEPRILEETPTFGFKGKGLAPASTQMFSPFAKTK